MAKRPQVQDLKTSTVVKPTANNVVDSYVTPPKPQTQASPLSQFVSALTPAVQEYTEQKQAAKLKREREVEQLTAQRKQKQLENQLFIGSTQIKQSLKNDAEVWNSLSEEEAANRINGYFTGYIEQLQEDGLDELDVERARIASENVATGLYMAFDAQKKEHQIKVDDDEFLKILVELNATEASTPEHEAATISLIHKHINDSAAVFPLSNGKPDFKRFTKIAHDYAKDISTDNPDTFLYRALEGMVKPDGMPINIMDTAERAADSSLMRARADKARVTAKVEEFKGVAISSALDDVFNNFNTSALGNVKHVNASGGTSSISQDDMEVALLSDERFQSMGAGQKFAFLARLDLTPKAYQSNIKNFINQASTIISGEVGEEEVAQMYASFTRFEAMRNSGMNLDFISDDDMYKLQALSYFVREEGLAGEVTVPDFDTSGVDQSYNIPNIARAAEKAFSLRPDEVKLTQKSINTVAGKVEDTTWFSSNHSNSYNANQVVQDVIGASQMLYATGMYKTEEDAIDTAIAIMGDDYKMVNSSDGTQYSVKLLNTDMAKTPLAVEYINEANQSIYNNENFKKWVNTTFPDTVKGDYVVAVTPDPMNPKAMQLALWQKDEDGQVSGITNSLLKFDKRKFLTDPAYLNNLLVGLPSAEEVGSSVIVTRQEYLARPENEELAAAIAEDEVPNVNFFGGSVGRPRPDEPFDADAPIPALTAEGWIEGFKDAADAAMLTTDSNQILNWLNENPPLFDVDGKRSVLNQAADLLFEAAKGDKFETKEIENNLTRLFDSATESGQQALDAVNDMLSSVQAPSFISSAAASTIIDEEGFEATPYTDDLRDGEGKQSVGHGLQIESLEPDERALIKDINNVTEEESEAVVNLKVDKISKWWDDTVEGFSNLPESSQVSAISMAFQLGKENVKNEWPKFMASVQEAAQYAQGSAEQAAALAEAKFNMLYNVAEDGAVSATKWATQTSERAMRMAEGMAASTGEFLSETGDVIAENVEAAGAGIVNAIIPSAEASDLKPAVIGEKPEAQAVAAIAGAKNPADVAATYLGMSENSAEGAAAVKGFFENVVGNWNPDNQSVEEFATSKAWCAAFLTQVLRDSGVDTKALLGADKFNQVRAAAYLKAGDAVEAPQVKAGDIMIKMHSAEDRKKYKLGVAHVGIVASVDGDTVYFIGGNTGDKVELADYNMTQEDVRFRRISGVTDLPTESLPSMFSLKAGKYGRKAMDKLSNGFNSLYDTIVGD